MQVNAIYISFSKVKILRSLITNHSYRLKPLSCVYPRKRPLFVCNSYVCVLETEILLNI